MNLSIWLGIYPSFYQNKYRLIILPNLQGNIIQEALWHSAPSVLVTRLRRNLYV